MKETIKMVFKPWSQTIPEGKKGLLLIDGSCAHLDKKGEIVNEFLNIHIEVMKFPPNLTSELQPNDLGINKPIKKLWQEMWMDYMA